MHTIRKTIVVLAVLALAMPVLATEEVTVGGFIQKLAQSKKLAATDSRVAMASLRGVGVRVPSDLDLTARLTEGDVARISRSFGLNVSTNRPDAVFNSDQVERFFSAFNIELLEGATVNSAQSSDNGNGPPFNPYSKGKGGSKGKKKGHNFTPTDPE